MAKLSPKAAAAKKKRDLAYAKTPRRTAMKAENQRKRRAAKKAGQNIEGKDYDHNRGRFVSVSTNRSGTKGSNNTKNTPMAKKTTGSIQAAKNTLMTGSPMKRWGALDSSSPMKNKGGKKGSKYSDLDRQAYEAYKKDFAKDVATGKYGATDRAPLSQDLAHRIGYKSPSQSKLALKSASRGHGREDVDPRTGRSATRALTSGDRAALGLDKDFKQTGRVMASQGGVSPVQKKRNPKRDSAKKASKGKASASYYSHGLTDKKSPAKKTTDPKKKKTLKEMAKKAVKSGWKPKPTPRKRTLKEMAKKANKK